MRILIVDNGSACLAAVSEALRGEKVGILGYPFVPQEFKERAAEADAVVISGEEVPAGVDLPYEREEVAAIAACTRPTLGIGKGAALVFEAHGGRVKSRAGGYEIKRAPSGWKETDGFWRDRIGNAAVFDLTVIKASVAGFLESLSGRPLRG